jgi:hypothetical protein
MPSPICQLSGGFVCAPACLASQCLFSSASNHLQGTTNAKRVNAIDPSRHKIVSAPAAAASADTDRSLEGVVHETDSDGTVDSDGDEDQAHGGPSPGGVCESPQQARAALSLLSLPTPYHSLIPTP